MEITEHVCSFCQEQKNEKLKNFSQILAAGKCKCSYLFCALCENITCKDIYCKDHGDYKDKVKKDKKGNQEQEEDSPIINLSRIKLRKIDFTSKEDRKEFMRRKKEAAYPNNEELGDEEEILKIMIKGYYNHNGYFAEISD